MSPSLASDPSTHAAHSFGRDTGVLTARSRGVYICSSPNEELRAQGHEPQPLSCRCSGPGEVTPRDRSLQSGVADTVLGGLSTGTQAWADRTRARRRTAAEIISGTLSKSFPDRNGEETSTEKCSFNSSFSIKFLAGWARVRTPSRRSSRSTQSARQLCARASPPAEPGVLQAGGCQVDSTVTTSGTLHPTNTNVFFKLDSNV